MEVEGRVLSLIGRHAIVKANRGILFDLLGTFSDGEGAIKFSMVSTLDGLNVASTRTEIDLRGFYDQDGIRLSSETLTAISDPYILGSVVQAVGSRLQEWRFKQAVEIVESDSLSAPDSYTIDLFPISRVMRIRIEDAARIGHPMAPFLPPVGDTNLEEKVINYFQREGIDIEGDPKASLRFDGEQLIVSHTAENLQRIRQLLLKFSDQERVRTTYELSFEDSDNVAQAYVVNLLGRNHKQAELILENGQMRSIDGINMFHAGITLRTIPAINRCYGYYEGISGDIEFRLDRVGGESDDEWYFISEKSVEPLGRHSESSLPAGAKIRWAFALDGDMR